MKEFEWKVWEGGQTQSLDNDKSYILRFRDGMEYVYTGEVAASFDWKHQNAPSDIMQYKQYQKYVEDTPQESKPPLGIPSKNIYLESCIEQRAKHIREAMKRYIDEDKEIPVEWLKELISIQEGCW